MSTITLDTLLEAMERLRAAAPSLMALTTSEFLTETRLRKLSRWERLRCWLEDASDRADLIYPWSRVVRSETVPSRQVYRIGDRLICHPAVAEEFRREACCPGRFLTSG